MLRQPRAQKQWAAPDAISPDRFLTPKASLTYTNQGVLRAFFLRLGGGTPAYGLPERPGLQVLRHAFEDTKCRENEAVEAAWLRGPAGLRHEAALHYEAAKHAAGATHGRELALAQGNAHCRRHRTVQTSLDNPLRGWWQESHTVCPGGLPEQAAGNCNARYAARLAFEAAHAGSLLNPKERSQARRCLMGAYRCAISCGRPDEESALQEYPHGLPALQLRRARQRGLQVGGLGFGMAPTRADQMAALLRTHEPRPGSAFR